MRESEPYVIPKAGRWHLRRNPDESDRAIRLLRVQTVAEETFGGKEKADTWLRRPLAELGGEPPLDIAQTEAGARRVETILAKIAWGAAA